MKRWPIKGVYRLPNRVVLLVAIVLLLPTANAVSVPPADSESEVSSIPVSFLPDGSVASQGSESIEASVPDLSGPSASSTGDNNRSPDSRIESMPVLISPILVPSHTVGYLAQEVILAEWGEGVGEIGYPPDGPESPSTGPISIAVDELSNVYIIDSVNQRILQFDSSGSYIRMVGYGPTVGALDLAATSARDIYLLDSTQGRLLRFDSHGMVADEVMMPPSMAQASRVIVGEDDLLMLEGIRSTMGAKGVFENVTLHLGKAGVPLTDLHLPEKISRGQPTMTGVYSLRLAPLSETSGIITISDTNGEVQFEASICTLDPLAGAALVEIDTEGSIYLRVDTLRTSFDLELAVDSMIAKFTPQGTLLGIIQVPSSYHTPVYHSVTVDRQGRVHMLVPEYEHVSVIRWDASASDDARRQTGASCAKAEGNSPQSDTQRSVDTSLPSNAIEPSSAWSLHRDAIIANAELYRTYSWYASDDNLRGRTCPLTCPVDGSPWTEGWHESVAYTWGGFDFIEEVDCYSGCIPDRNYQFKLDRGTFVGDTATGCIPDAGCTAGIDCSGFVSRVWEEGRYTTATLNQISDALSISELLRGDILLGPSHVVLFTYFDAGGQPVYYEVTNSPPYKVWLDVHSGWPGVAGFTPRRYEYVVPP